MTGKCFGPITNMVFLVAKEAPAPMAAALKKVLKRDSGLTVIPEFQVAGDADAEEAEHEEDTGAPKAGAGTHPRPVRRPWRLAVRSRRLPAVRGM